MKPIRNTISNNEKASMKANNYNFNNPIEAQMEKISAGEVLEGVKGITVERDTLTFKDGTSKNVPNICFHTIDGRIFVTRSWGVFFDLCDIVESWPEFKAPVNIAVSEESVGKFKKLHIKAEKYEGPKVKAEVPESMTAVEVNTDNLPF